jgi:hypothetical protein
VAEPSNQLGDPMVVAGTGRGCEAGEKSEAMWSNILPPSPKK